MREAHATSLLAIQKLTYLVNLADCHYNPTMGLLGRTDTNHLILRSDSSAQIKNLYKGNVSQFLNFHTRTQPSCTALVTTFGFCFSLEEPYYGYLPRSPRSEAALPVPSGYSKNLWRFRKINTGPLHHLR